MVVAACAVLKAVCAVLVAVHAMVVAACIMFVDACAMLMDVSMDERMAAVSLLNPSSSLRDQPRLESCKNVK